MGSGWTTGENGSVSWSRPGSGEPGRPHHGSDGSDLGPSQGRTRKAPPGNQGSLFCVLAPGLPGPPGRAPPCAAVEHRSGAPPLVQTRRKPVQSIHGAASPLHVDVVACVLGAPGQIGAEGGSWSGCVATELARSSPASAGAGQPGRRRRVEWPAFLRR